jgi:hypothetical protein
VIVLNFSATTGALQRLYDATMMTLRVALKFWEAALVSLESKGQKGFLVNF